MLPLCTDRSKPTSAIRSSPRTPQMSPEQIGQLYELMMAARGGVPMSEQEREKQIEDTLTDMGISTTENQK